MTPEKEINKFVSRKLEIKIGISTGCLMGKSPELALRTIFQQREIREALIAANEIGLDGIELFYRRGLTFEKFNLVLESIEKLENKPHVLTVHAPLYYDRHSPSFGKTDTRFASWLLAYMSGFFKNEPAPRLAEELKAPLVVHADIIRNLEKRGEILKEKPWLIETEKPPYPQEVLEMAKSHNLNLVFDTSRITLANLPLRESWEAYTQNGVEKVEVIHFSGKGGKIVHHDELREFFQQVLRDGWQGIIIIEHAPLSTSGRTYEDKKDQIKYTLDFLLANEIKPRRSYSHP